MGGSMIYHLYRDAFSEVCTYRYRMTDEGDVLLLQALWPSMGPAAQPEQIFFESAEGERVALLNWEERGWWLGDRFHLFLTGQEAALAMIQEHWHIVDRLLLHLPRYRVDLMDGNALEVRGNRYGESLYEIFALPAAGSNVTDEDGIRLGEITHPASGPTYVLRTESPLLVNVPLFLLALSVVVDLWGLKRE